MAKKRSLIARVLLNPKALIFLGLGIIILISFPIAKNASQRRNISMEVRGLEKEIKLIEDKNTQLQKLISYLSSDQYVEEQARLNFGLKKEGERAVVVDARRNLSAPADGSASVAIGKESQNAPDAGLPDDLAGIKLAKSIYNIPSMEKARPKNIISNYGRWWKYFFGG